MDDFSSQSAVALALPAIDMWQQPLIIGIALVDDPCPEVAHVVDVIARDGTGLRSLEEGVEPFVIGIE